MCIRDREKAACDAAIPRVEIRDVVEPDSLPAAFQKTRSAFAFRCEVRKPPVPGFDNERRLSLRLSRLAPGTDDKAARALRLNRLFSPAEFLVGQFRPVTDRLGTLQRDARHPA